MVTQEQIDRIVAKADVIASVGGSLLSNASLLRKWAGELTPDEDQPEPPAAALRVGARAKEASGSLSAAFDLADSTFGPLTVTRAFEQGLPSTHVPITPDGVLEIVSYKSSTAANVASFVASMRPGTLLAFHHEPEGYVTDSDGGKVPEYATGADFVAAFTAEAEKVHAAGGTLGMISGGYQWRNGHRAVDGSFLPPAADWYAIDTYRTGTDTNFNAVLPLEQVAEFQSWLAAVKDLGKPLGVTEYGRGIVDGSGYRPESAGERAAAIAADGPYLAGLGFFCWVLWWTNESPGKDWKFTDAASIDAVQALTAGQ